MFLTFVFLKRLGVALPKLTKVSRAMSKWLQDVLTKLTKVGKRGFRQFWQYGSGPFVQSLEAFLFPNRTTSIRP
jgi:hypothetical protein